MSESNEGNGDNNLITNSNFVIKIIKIRSGVNFINVKRANFSYKCWFWQLFSSYMYVPKQRLYEKFVRLTLMKLTPARSSLNRDIINMLSHIHLPTVSDLNDDYNFSKYYPVEMHFKISLK